MVAGLYAALLGIWFIVLSLRVIALRGNPAFNWFSFRNQGDISLQRAIRGHGNLTEYAPIFLILLYFVEKSGFGVRDCGTLVWFSFCFRSFNAWCLLWLLGKEYVFEGCWYDPNFISHSWFECCSVISLCLVRKMFENVRETPIG